MTPLCIGNYEQAQRGVKKRGERGEKNDNQVKGETWEKHRSSGGLYNRRLSGRTIDKTQGQWTMSRHNEETIRSRIIRSEELAPFMETM